MEGILCYLHSSTLLWEHMQRSNLEGLFRDMVQRYYRKPSLYLQKCLKDFFFFWPCRTACWTFFPHQGSNPCPLQWKHSVLAIGPPGKSLKDFLGTSLVAQWLRIRLPMQGTRVRALVREDPTCRGATKPVRHNY